MQEFIKKIKMTTELVKIDPIEFGLTEETAKNIRDQFSPMLDKMVELENEFNEIVVLPIEDANTSKKAKELRLKYVKIRTATSDIHKKQKAFYLNGGRFVDGWKNAQLFASKSKEDKLEEIEKYAENQERERIEKLNLERVELIRQYVEDTTCLSLGSMEEDVFEAFFTAKKKNYYDRIEAERIAEEQRLAKEREEIEAREKQRLENERLKKEAELREIELKKEREKLEEERRINEGKLRIEREKVEKERKESEEKIRLEREKAEKERLRIEAENKEKLYAERKEREKLEKEIKERKEEEESIKKEEEDRAKKDAKAPVKKRLTTWVDNFSIPEIDIENEKKELIKSKFNAFKEWAKKEIENI